MSYKGKKSIIWTFHNIYFKNLRILRLCPRFAICRTAPATAAARTELRPPRPLLRAEEAAEARARTRAAASGGGSRTFRTGGICAGK